MYIQHIIYIILNVGSFVEHTDYRHQNEIIDSNSIHGNNKEQYNGFE